MCLDGVYGRRFSSAVSAAWLVCCACRGCLQTQASCPKRSPLRPQGTALPAALAKPPLSARPPACAACILAGPSHFSPHQCNSTPPPSLLRALAPFPRSDPIHLNALPPAVASHRDASYAPLPLSPHFWRRPHLLMACKVSCGGTRLTSARRPLSRLERLIHIVHLRPASPGPSHTSAPPRRRGL
jgi:hypothetical protein